MCSDGVEITTNLGPVVVLSSSNSPQSVTLALGMDTLSFSAGAISGDVNLVVSAPMSADIDSGADLPPAAPQGLPMPTSGNCADITNDSVYAYGTGLTGGWTKQWGDWAHAWVCARTLTYDGGRWIVTD